MGIVPRLRDASTRIAGMTFLDREGRQAARVDLEALRRSIAPQDIELPRGDLSAILHEAGRDSAEFIFGDSVTSLVQDNGRGVDVAFEHSRPRRFDLVIGADGLHSIVRRLASARSRALCVTPGFTLRPCRCREPSIPGGK
jgi:2-polyprenyl-6-methoxyphenol hydroxylase-like FAD-dependent oxidoreductase